MLDSHKRIPGINLRVGSDTGIRTRVSAVRGRRPGPLDDIANEINNLREGHETHHDVVAVEN